MRKIIMYGLIAISIIILVPIIILLSNPLRKSEETIKKRILGLTPIGTSLENVIIAIENEKNWKYHLRDYGYVFMHGMPFRGSPRGDEPVVGVKSLDVYLGKYRTIFDTGVSVFYAFDENSKLIDIAVLKETDSF